MRQVVNKLGGKDRSRSRRRGGAKQERGRSGGSHPRRSASGRHSTTTTGSQICSSWNRAKDGCSLVCSSNIAHACEFCLEPHRATECPLNPGWKPPTKGAEKGRHKSKQWLCLWCLGHHPRCHHTSIGLECGVSEGVFQNE